MNMYSRDETVSTTIIMTNVNMVFSITPVLLTSAENVQTIR